jgi:hypothetical protein
MDHNNIIESRKRVWSAHDNAVEHATHQAKKRTQTASTPPEQQVHKPAIFRTPKLIRGETHLYPPGTPIFYTFHSCDATTIREALRIIHTEDISLNLNLSTMSFSLPRYLEDNGSAVSWLVSLTTCLAWCFHRVYIADISITEPELGVEEPYIAVNEKELPTLRMDLYAGNIRLQASTELSTTAAELVTSFLNFTQGLPEVETNTEEQVIFALADFLHNRPDKCKSCVLWRAAWKQCLNILYGEEVARSMVKERKFRPACQ